MENLLRDGGRGSPAPRPLRPGGGSEGLEPSQPAGPRVASATGIPLRHSRRSWTAPRRTRFRPPVLRLRLPPATGAPPGSGADCRRAAPHRGLRRRVRRPRGDQRLPGQGRKYRHTGGSAWTGCSTGSTPPKPRRVGALSSYSARNPRRWSPASTTGSGATTRCPRATGLAMTAGTPAIFP